MTLPYDRISFPHRLPQTGAVRRHASRGIAMAAAIGLLAACASVPPEPSTPALTTATPAEMVATVRAAAGDGEGELNVQPLRDPGVEDLRERAARLEAQGFLDDAAAALDDAMALVPADPALLQERAELALLMSDFDLAADLAGRAQASGAGVGPLCRRHWATLEQVRLVRADAEGAAEARAAIDACRVAPPPRW